MTMGKSLDLIEQAKILWNDEWGVPKDRVSEREAGEQGLTKLRGRWVPKHQSRNIQRILRARASVKSCSYLAFAIAATAFLIAIPAWTSYGSNPHPLERLTVIMGVTACIAAGVAIRWYARWAYILMMSLYALLTIGLTIVIVMLVMLAVDLQAAKEAPVAYMLMVLPAGTGIVLLACMYRLTREPVRCIFRKDMQQALRETAKARPVMRALGYGAFGLVMTLNVAYTYMVWSSYSPCGHHCDRGANAVASKLGAALERLGNEIVDAGCAITPEKLKNDLRLEYLVGPYYGWTGTPVEWEVRVRIVGDEVWVCTPLGSRPTEDEDVRWVYRVSILGGTDLPAEFGKCEGSSYGGPDDYCYTSSMLGDDCRIREPEVKKPCREIRNSDEK